MIVSKCIPLPEKVPVKFYSQAAGRIRNGIKEERSAFLLRGACVMNIAQDGDFQFEGNVTVKVVPSFRAL